MRTISSIFSLFIYLGLRADNEAELFYSSGKIYVVVGVLLMIFAGIISYLIRLERKIAKLEKNNEA